LKSASFKTQHFQNI